jgi:hypothetical protein
MRPRQRALTGLFALVAACGDGDPAGPAPNPFIGRWLFNPTLVLDCPTVITDITVTRLNVTRGGVGTLVVSLEVGGLAPGVPVQATIAAPPGRTFVLADTIPTTEVTTGVFVDGTFDLAGALEPGDSTIVGTAEAQVNVNSAIDFSCTRTSGPFEVNREN